MIGEADSKDAPSRASVSRGVLLVGHGTRDEVGTAQFFELATRLCELLSPIPVEAALLEFQRPTIPQAWESLVSGGAEHIHVAPLLLFAAGHAKQDIPDIIADCRAKTPNVSFDQARPISRHCSIIELVVRRLQGTLKELESPPSRTAIVMVGRGSHDPCAQADMRVLSEVVSRRVEGAATMTAFYAMAEPRLPDVLERVAGSERYDGIVVHPHLLFEGRLYQAIVKQTKEAAQHHPQVRLATSPYLGPDPLVAQAIAARIGLAASVPFRS
jgi:sirohydrochlorin cobaltochelatase